MVSGYQKLEHHKGNWDTEGELGTVELKFLNCGEKKQVDWGKSIPGRGKGQCKILEVGACLDYSKNRGRPVWLQLYQHRGEF